MVARVKMKSSSALIIFLIFILISSNRWSITDGNDCLDFQLIESLLIEIKLLLLIGFYEITKKSADKNTKLLDLKFHFLSFAWRDVMTVDI